jgi:predicted RNA binding protein YcfA (HicA-like mRNA interferase family)
MPSEVRFSEIQRLLESHGYRLRRISGSHHIFDKPGERPVTIPVHHGRVKHVYLRQIRKALETD